MSKLILSKVVSLSKIFTVVCILVVPFMFGMDNVGLFLFVVSICLVALFAEFKSIVANIKSYIKLDTEYIEFQRDNFNCKYDWNSISFQFVESKDARGHHSWSLSIYENEEFVSAFIFDDFDIRREKFKELVSRYSKRSDIFKPDKMEFMGIELKKRG